MSAAAAVRLALIVPSLGAGGAERVVSRLADRWAAAGHEVHVLTLAGPERPPYYRLDPAVVLHPLGLMGRSASLLGAAAANLRRLRRLRRALAEIRPAAALAFLPEAGALATLAALGRGVPVIVSERNSPVDDPLSRPWRLLRGMAYRAAAAVVFQTERARDAFPRPIRARGVVIPNPVPAQPPPGADPDAPEIVAAGRLTPQKGFDLLIDAFAALAPHRPGWSLTIWGEGPERSRLEALAAARGLRDRVRLPGVSPEPGAWLRGGSVFALSSRYEGFPNALCEAMAAGYAVAAADCRFGPREIVAHGVDGLLVPSGDPAALATALLDLTADAGRRRALGAAARQAVARFEPTAVARDWDGLIERVAAGRRRSWS